MRVVDFTLEVKKMKTDLEISTFQKSPAYRYIRAADNVPAIGAGATVALIKLFDPTGGWTWYISEYDPKTREAFGLVDGFEKELGYFNMEEIVDLRGRLGLPIERDLHWEPQLLTELT